MNENRYRPRMRFFHPNAKGTGCALSLELLPASEGNEGCIMASLANQQTVGGIQGSERTYPTFNWEEALTVKLGFADLCKMLQVMRGESESLGDGKGLYHSSGKSNTRISMRHLVEPVSGYALDVNRMFGDGREARASILLSPWEALGLAESIAGSMSVISFGVPSVRMRAEKPADGKHEAA